MGERINANELDLIWGAKNIALEIRRTQRQTFALLEKGEIPGQRIGGRWVVERGKLKAFFLGEAA
ncbi:hypothetical protein [Brucella anthropi]|uniref:hypothetical protein n=1 Tax=Brucella anthropi TaxID=529 RepID=UPI0004ED9053|nr:hypothetical protein [Brucella anthropi]AIK43094.1 hypothetical protein DR92_423 [Brucella anthropi]KAB2736908.1 DNA-binding protein [Brucella anthropi]KAB2751031.1 DNA-binding protein [Brucella anthropi]KAB2779056.1 DNA-binding protein [Brucella anthropi]QQC25167.1 DNA-binding protein [Brucella anthropi]